MGITFAMHPIALSRAQDGNFAARFFSHRIVRASGRIVDRDDIERGRPGFYSKGHIEVPMDDLFFHPRLVHLPVALAVLMPLVSAGLLFSWFYDLLPRRAWIIAVALQAVLVLSSVAALRTGEAEEERVERVVAESAIEAHEEAAELFAWLAGGLLVLYVAGAAIPSARIARVVAGAATVASLVVLIFGYRVGHSGGELVYRHGAASAYTTGAAATGNGAEAVIGDHRAPAGDDDD